MLEEIAMYEDDPQELIFDVLGETIFPDHPLGRATLGRAEVVSAATREELLAFHRERYFPGNIVIAAAGSVEHERIVAWAGEARGHRAPRQPAQALPAPAERRETRFRLRDTEQYHLTLGATALARDDDRRFALRVLDSILGGTSSSRLFQAVREQRGLAYSVFTFQSLYRTPGRSASTSARGPENLVEVCEVLAGELARIREEPVSAEELERAKDNVKGRIVLALESTSARMDRLGSAARRHADPRARRDDRAHRGRRPRPGRRARGRAARTGAALRRGDRSRRGCLPRRDRAAHAGARGDAVIRVGVAGASGRMGLAVCAAVSAAEDLELSGRADPRLGVTLAEILGDCDVVVDFTQPDVALDNALACLGAGVHVVIGTTGFDVSALEGVTGANAFVAPNFAIGAVLMMSFAAQAAKHMAAAEIIELHHDGKLDAPSGTAAAPPS